MKLFSVDVESDGLYGRPIAIGVLVTEDRQVMHSLQLRLPDSEVTNQWVKENVLPAIASMKVTHEDSDSMVEEFWKFWMEHRDGATVIGHCVCPVESNLFRRAVFLNPDRTFEGPLPIHDVGTLLLKHGHAPTSVDNYLKVTGQGVPEANDGLSPHHPLYDAAAAVMVWCDLFP